MIQLSELTKTFGDRTLFDRVTWQIDDGDRVGLCGPNGAGKTTLLKMLAGMDEADSGVVAKPADLNRLPASGWPRASGSHGLRGSQQCVSAAARHQAEMHDIEHKLADSSIPQDAHDEMLSRYAELQDRFRLGDGYSMDLRIATVLRGLGFAPETRIGQCETFSGGWQMRIALAKLLLGRPNLLLLDEPTNHLDLEARNWLEEYLGAYPYAVILVSHDRYFLDAVVTRITDVHLRKLADYVGNYSKCVELRVRCSNGSVRPSANRTRRSRASRCSSIGSAIRPPRLRRCRAASRCSRKWCRSRLPPERKRIHFRFPDCMKSGRTVLELKHARKAYDRSRCSATYRCTSSEATASRSSARTAPASPP